VPASAAAQISPDQRRVVSMPWASRADACDS
jgi:hypothetical protein